MENLSDNFDYNYTYGYPDYITYCHFPFFEEPLFDFTTISRVITWTVVLTGFPLTLLAIYALFTLVRNNHVAPVFVINLLIADLIQLCCLSVKLTDAHWTILNASVNIYIFGVTASVVFMVIVAMERYLVIAWPLWYNLRSTIKLSVVVCVVVWTLSLVFILSIYFCLSFHIAHIIFGISLLVPFPLLIFFLVGSLKALSAADHAPTDEKLRIMGILVLVLLIYTLLFLPYSICALVENWTLFHLSLIPIEFSPLANLIMYVFIRKGIKDKLLCSCRTDSSSLA